MKPLICNASWDFSFFVLKTIPNFSTNHLVLCKTCPYFMHETCGQFEVCAIFKIRRHAHVLTCPRWGGGGVENTTLVLDIKVSPKLEYVYWHIVRRQENQCFLSKRGSPKSMLNIFVEYPHNLWVILEQIILKDITYSFLKNSLWT